MKCEKIEGWIGGAQDFIDNVIILHSRYMSLHFYQNSYNICIHYTSVNPDIHYGLRVPTMFSVGSSTVTSQPFWWGILVLERVMQAFIREKCMWEISELLLSFVVNLNFFNNEVY